MLTDSPSMGESALVLKERVDEVVCGGRVSEFWCGGEDDYLGGSFGRRRFSVEMGESFGMGGVFRGCVDEVGDGSVSSRGLELVPFSRLLGRGVSVWDSQKEDLFNDLGWVEEVIDDGLGVTNEVFNPLAVREPGGEWIEEDKLASGMSQEEVSKWVLRRISGFSKFLGLSFDGFEENDAIVFGY